jgi:hypothetical protein
MSLRCGVRGVLGVPRPAPGLTGTGVVLAGVVLAGVVASSLGLVGVTFPWAAVAGVVAGAELVIVVVDGELALVAPPQPAPSAAQAAMISEQINDLNITLFA